MPRKGQNNQPITLCAGREVSERCEQSHGAAEKDTFGVNFFFLKKRTINLAQRPVFARVSNKSQRASLSKVSTRILSKTLKLFETRNGLT